MGGATLGVAPRPRPGESSDFFTVRTVRRQAGTAEGSPTHQTRGTGRHIRAMGFQPVIDASLATVLGVGFLLGVRHATEADHVAAVSTFVAEHRTVGRSCLLGAFWGAGHALALGVAGMAMIVFRVTLSPAIERMLETAVALLLIGLGVRALLRAAPITLHRHRHLHGTGVHTHVHLHVGRASDHEHVHLGDVGRRPFVVGIVHGLAGSGAIVLLVLATVRSPLVALLYIVVFGLGATVGMLAMSGLVAVPLALTARRSRMARTIVSAATGIVSVAVGLALLRGSP
jgi:hypothetical protein